MVTIELLLVGAAVIGFGSAMILSSAHSSIRPEAGRLTQMLSVSIKWVIVTILGVLTFLSGVFV